MPDWLWVQCERCLKWRRLPDSAHASQLPNQWFCHMNPDPTHKSVVYKNFFYQQPSTLLVVLLVGGEKKNIQLFGVYYEGRVTVLIVVHHNYTCTFVPLEAEKPVYSLLMTHTLSTSCVWALVAAWVLLCI